MSNLFLILIYVILSIIALLIMSILIYYFNKKILNSISIIQKIIFCNIILTFLFLFLILLYLQFISLPLNIVNYLTLSAFCLIFIFIIYFTNYFILKPIKKIKNYVYNISNNFYRFKILNKNQNKDFEDIFRCLQIIIDNNLIVLSRLNKAKKLYLKYIPKQVLTYLGKDDIFDVTLGDNSIREVTIMIFDIRSSSQNSKSVSMSQNYKVVSNVLKKTGNIITEFNGFIERYEGDGILALFVNSDDAMNASIKISKYFNSNNFVESMKIYIGIALERGKVMVAVIGDENRLSATVLSDSVNLLAKIEKLNKEFGTQIIFTKNVLNDLKQKFSYRFLGNYDIDGAFDRVSLFENLNTYSVKVRKQLEINSVKQLNIINSLQNVKKPRKNSAKPNKELYVKDSVFKNVIDYIEKSKKNN